MQYLPSDTFALAKEKDPLRSFPDFHIHFTYFPLTPAFITFTDSVSYTIMGVKNMNPCELASYLSALSCAIFNTFPKEDLPVLAAALMQLGDTLTTMIAQAENCTKDN